MALNLGVGVALFPIWVGLAVAQEHNQFRPDLTEKDRQRVIEVTAPTSDFSKAEAFENMQAGAMTSLLTPDEKAFTHPAANLPFEARERFFLGSAIFDKLWVSSPSSTFASDGLGPHYNARACQSCHQNSGRGTLPQSQDELISSLLLRLSVPPKTGEKTASLPEPNYGYQLQNLAVPGLQKEGNIEIRYTEFPVALNGGETVYLRAPEYSISELGYGPLEPDTMLSPRLAPQMIGLGLLEAIHPEDLLAQADPDDENGDGISGRAHWVKDADGEHAIGRFGHKASHAQIITQSAAAFSGDLGLSTPLFPNHWGDCTSLQEDCYALPHGAQPSQGNLEVPQELLDLVTNYSQNLATPARRNVDDPMVLRGKQVFYESGCASCHTPKYVTRRDNVDPQFQFQLIWPYTDLLLHDMGEGLADNRPDGEATGREWKTPPLWGIGLTKLVSGDTNFLHDGRARTLLEAVLWHGGEAEAAKQTVVDLPPADRKALIEFLESL